MRVQSRKLKPGMTPIPVLMPWYITESVNREMMTVMVPATDFRVTLICMCKACSGLVMKGWNHEIG